MKLTNVTTIFFIATLFLMNCKNSSSETSDKEESMKIEQFSIEGATVGELVAKLENGELTSVAIAKMYLARIDEIDKSGPSINSVIELNPDALGIAQKMDEERKNNKVRSALHGIPIMIKDNIDTGDKMQTTAGALVMEGHIAEKDAYVVKKLRAAGMVLLGKTNLSEWANFRSTSSTSGWSGRGGQTLNPYILTQNPCGSSSGSGAAAAASLAAVTIGTETDGSVTCPASANGIVGIKPSIGLVSRSGIIPISHNQDTAGPMGRTVADVASLLGVMIGYDKDDSVTEAARSFENIDYTTFLNLDGLEGKRIGVDRSNKSSEDKLNTIVDKIISDLEKAGAVLVDVPFNESVGKIGKNEYDVLMYEFKDGLNKYLSSHNAPVRSLEEIIAYNLENKEKAMPFFEQEILVASQAKGSLNTPEYKSFVLAKDAAQTLIDKLMKDHNLDALMGLTVGPACDIDYVKGDVWADLYTPPAAAIAGYAHISVPGGFVDGLPVGLSLFAGAFQEGKLIEMAYAYEQATQHRVEPRYLSTKP